MKRSLPIFKRDKQEDTASEEGTDVYSFPDDSSEGCVKKACLTKSHLSKSTSTGETFKFLKNSKNPIMFKHAFNGSDAIIVSNTDLATCNKNRTEDNTKSSQDKYGDTSECNIEGRSPRIAKENGEAADHKNDVLYVMSGLKESNVNVKILSAIHLARKCSEPEFRHFCRSQDVFDLFLNHTKDMIDSNPAMALVISTVLYLLSRDKGQFPFSDKAANAILHLLKVNSDSGDEYLKAKNKIKVIFEKWIETANSNTTKQIKFDLTDEKLCPKNITLEALVFICISNGSTKFRDSIKANGILEWVIDEFDIVTNKCVDKKDVSCRQLNILLRILHNMCTNHKNNKYFITNHNSHSCLKSLENLVTFFTNILENDCKNEPMNNELSHTFQLVLNILVALTEENELSCVVLGKSDDFLQRLCQVICNFGPQYISEKYRFSLTIACSGCLANIIESCGRIRKKVLGLKCNYYDGETKTIEEDNVIVAFTKHFKYWESKITLIDEDMDNMLDIENDLENDDSTSDDDETNNSKKDNQARKEMIKLRNEQKERDCDALFTQAAEKYATSHMEANLLASFSAINIGLLIEDDEDIADSIRKYLPGEDFLALITLLYRFLEFTHQLNQPNCNACTKAINKIIETLSNFDLLR
uniref:WAPL domain-containing protein n=1 Tax=Parastrongyloides trichosuri TaxID=131310 RepID=A0A0N5A3J8_PARTI